MLALGRCQVCQAWAQKDAQCRILRAHVYKATWIIRGVHVCGPSIHTYVCMCIYIYTCLLVHACTYVRTHVRTYVRRYVCMYVCRYTCVGRHLYAPVNGHVCICVSVCIDAYVGVSFSELSALTRAACLTSYLNPKPLGRSITKHWPCLSYQLRETTGYNLVLTECFPTSPQAPSQTSNHEPCLKSPIRGLKTCNPKLHKQHLTKLFL